MNNSKALIILGPSASGKTNLALKWASKLNKDVLSADSRQIYKNLDYCTGKYPSLKIKVSKHKEYWDIGGTKYWGYDLINPNKVFSSVEFLKFTNRILNNSSKIPIICGGTGLYIKSIIGKLEFNEGIKNEKLRRDLEKKTAAEILKILTKSGYEVENLNNSEKNNKQRLIRKVELLSNKKSCSLKSLFPKEEDCLVVGLNLEKIEYENKIEEWLNRDFEKMKVEVTWLRDKHPTSPLFMGFIFKEIDKHLKNEINEEASKILIKTNYIQYIKRQNTFFKNQFNNVNWFNNVSKANKFIEKELQQ